MDVSLKISKVISRSITVSSPDGAEEPAELVICPACQGEAWVIFALAKHDHHHIQCVECGTSYCSKGTRCD